MLHVYSFFVFSRPRQLHVNIFGFNNKTIQFIIKFSYETFKFLKLIHAHAIYALTKRETIALYVKRLENQ